MPDISDVHVLLNALDPPIRKRKLTNERAFELICYVLKIGLPWSELKYQLHGVSASAVYKRFEKWTKDGVLEKIWITILDQYSTARLSQSPHWFKELSVDTSMIKNVKGRDCVGPNPTDRGRKATKVSFIIDQAMVPVSCQFYPANHNDITTLIPAVQGIACRIHLDNRYRSVLAADKGYVSKPIADMIHREHRIAMIVPTKKGMKKRVFTAAERDVLRRRHKVENTFCRFDKFKRLHCRNDAKLVSYKAFNLV